MIFFRSHGSSSDRSNEGCSVPLFQQLADLLQSMNFCKWSHLILKKAEMGSNTTLVLVGGVDLKTGYPRTIDV